MGIRESIFSDRFELQNSDVICCRNLATRRSHVREEETVQMVASFKKRWQSVHCNVYKS